MGVSIILVLLLALGLGGLICFIRGLVALIRNQRSRVYFIMSVASTALFVVLIVTLNTLRSP